MIRIEHLRKQYDNAIPLKDVSVTINDGDVISIIGPSGTGKSTLIRCLNLLERPTSGKVFIDDEEITDPACDINRIRRKMGMVFQSFNLFGHMTVIENIMAAPMDLLGKSKQGAYDEGMRLLRIVGLAEKALNYPDELSGGQKQRIAIARTLAMDPEVIFFDEPTSALDPTMVGEVEAVIKELAKTGKILMIVTHEMRFARAICNRVFYMDQGGIYEDGTPEQIFDNPEKELTRRFIKKLKVHEIRIEDKDYDYIGLSEGIELYAVKNQFPHVLTAHIRHAFEELVHVIMIPALSDPKVEVTIMYSDEDATASMEVRYNGPEKNVLEKGEELSMKLLEGITRAIEYEVVEGELTNQIMITF